MKALLAAKAELDAALEAYEVASPFVGSHLTEARRLLVDAVKREGQLRREIQSLRRQLRETRRKAGKLAGRADVLETSAALNDCLETS